MSCVNLNFLFEVVVLVHFECY